MSSFSPKSDGASSNSSGISDVPNYCRVLKFKDSNGQIKEMIFPKALDLDRPKRPRTTFSEDQLKVLEMEFQNSQYLIGRDRTKLAESLGLSETQIKVWFQNRRTKSKRERIDDPDPDPEGAADAAAIVGSTEDDADDQDAAVFEEYKKTSTVDNNNKRDGHPPSMKPAKIPKINSTDEAAVDHQQQGSPFFKTINNGQTHQQQQQQQSTGATMFSAASNLTTLPPSYNQQEQQQQILFDHLPKGNPMIFQRNFMQELMMGSSSISNNNNTGILGAGTVSNSSSNHGSLAHNIHPTINRNIPSSSGSSISSSNHSSSAGAASMIPSNYFISNNSNSNSLTNPYIFNPFPF